MHLVGDIGATNARFALVAGDGTLTRGADLLCREHGTLAEAIEAYLATAEAEPPAQAVLAVATSPRGDRVCFTNNSWSFSTAELAERIGIARLRVINDFHANALALAHLSAGDVRQVGGGTAVDGAPMGVIGPGSGLGVSAAVRLGAHYEAIAGEGGHVTMAAADDVESAVLEVLRRRFAHVSAERVLSGPGLVNLYGALCEVRGRPPVTLTAEQIAAAGADESDSCAVEAVAMFCAMLGTVAGNLALTLGARGGIYIAGGIVPKLAETFVQSDFRDRFEDKGRLGDYLAAIPTFVITRHHAALLGAAQLLSDA